MARLDAAPTRGTDGGRGPQVHVPAIARVIIRLIRLLPALVAIAFGGWAVAAALAGEAAIVAATALMSLLALSVAVRSAMSARDI